MPRYGSVFLLASTLVLAARVPVPAHHSVTAEFDRNKPITVTGTVKLVEWTNPHIYTHVEVKEGDGRVVVYRVEGAAPNGLYRQGWRKDSLKIGEVVTVNGFLAKIESSMHIGQATITTSDGRKIYGVGAAGGPAEPPRP